MLSLRSAARPAVAQIGSRGYAAAAPKPDESVDGDVAGSQPESSTAPLRRRLEAVVRERDAANAAAAAAAVEVAMTSAASTAPTEPAMPNPLTLPTASPINVEAKLLPRKLNRGTPGPPRVGPRARALLRAQAIAKALAETRPPLPSPSGATPTPSSALDAGPTLDDLLAKRPPFEPNTSRGSYPKLYGRIFSSISNAFLTQQLVKLAREMGLRISLKSPKAKTVERVMEDWGWPHPSSLDLAVDRATIKRERGATLSERDIELPAAELFHFLRDTDRMKHFVEDRRVVFSFPPLEQSVEPTKLGEGIAGSRRIVRMKSTQGIFETIVKLVDDSRDRIKVTPLGIDQVHDFRAPSELLASISSLSGGYIELTGDEYSLHTRRDAQLRSIRRLLDTAAFELHARPARTPVSLLTPVNSPATSMTGLVEYHLPPFFPAHNNPLPWYLQPTYSGRTLFRARGVTKWATKVGQKEVRQWEEKLEGAVVQAVPTAATASLISTKEKKELAEMISGLASALPRGDKGTELSRTFSVRFGHVLIPSPNTGLAATFASPIKLSFTADEMPKKMKRINTETIFAPSPTPALIHAAPSTTTKRLRRIRYRSITSSPGEPTAIFTCTYGYPEVNGTSSKPQQGEAGGIRTADAVERSWKDDLGDLLERAVKRAKEEEESQAAKEADSPEAAAYAKWEETSRVEDAARDLDTQGVRAATESALEESAESEVAEADEDLEQFGNEEVSSAEDLESASTSATADRPQVKLPVTAELSWETQTDLLMPDRPIDARLTTGVLLTLESGQIPARLQAIFRGMHNRAPAAERLPRILKSPSALDVLVNGETQRFVLEMDEEVQVQEKEILIGRLPFEQSSPVREAVSPFDVAPLPELSADAAISTNTVPVTEAEPPQSVPDSPGAPTNTLLVRNVTVTDYNTPDRNISYSELESRGAEVPEEFWREFAYVSRDVPPGAAALRRSSIFQ